MNDRLLKKTSILLTAQVLVSAGSLFALYAFIYRTLGPAALGLWSLVLATTGVARFSDLGLSGSLGRFVARHRALDDAGHAILVVETGVLSVLALLAFVGAIVFPALHAALGWVVPRDKLAIAFALLPYAIVSLVASAVASAIQGSLDGCGRLDVRALLAMSGTILYVLLAVALSRRYGLIGLAWAQVIQALFLVIFGWAMLRRVLAGLPLFPGRWRGAVFREMIGYSTAYQVSGVATLLAEPVTKIFIAKYGGLADVGVYEMASRAANQFRSLITAPQQSILPRAAHAGEKGRGAIVALYEKSVESMFLVLCPALAVLVAAGPLISKIWFGSVNRKFLLLFVVLALAVGLQTIIGPAYFCLLGVGRASWVALGSMTTGISNVLCGVVLGPLLGTAGIVAGAAFSLLAGSAIPFVRFHLRYQIGCAVFQTRRNLYGLVLVGAAALTVIGVEAVTSRAWSESWAAWAEVLLLAILASLLTLRSQARARVAWLGRRSIAQAKTTPTFDEAK